MARPALLLLLLLGACARSDAPRPADPTVESEPAGADAPEPVDLGAFGYTTSTEDEEEDVAGVVLDRPEATSPGYDLCTEIQAARARLIDARGESLRTWEGAGDYAWQRAELAHDGRLYVIGCRLARAEEGTSEAAGREADGVLVLRFLACYDFGGHELWRRELPVHHDLDLLPDGRLLVLTERRVHPPPPFPEAGLIDNGVALCDAQGRLLEEHSLYEALTREPRRFRLPKKLRESQGGQAVDFAHLNTVQWLDPARSAAAALGAGEHVLLTARHLNAVLILTWPAFELVAFAGQGELLGPHDAHLLANGSVLVLDNGAPDRGWSRVLELELASGRVPWQWRRAEPSAFWTPAQGTVQALPGGNVLIGNSNAGEAIEITRAGDEVWRYLTPTRTPSGRRAMLRIERYPRDRIEPLLR